MPNHEAWASAETVGAGSRDPRLAVAGCGDRPRTCGRVVITRMRTRRRVNIANACSDRILTSCTLCRRFHLAGAALRTHHLSPRRSILCVDIAALPSFFYATVHCTGCNSNIVLPRRYPRRFLTQCSRHRFLQTSPFISSRNAWPTNLRSNQPSKTTLSPLDLDHLTLSSTSSRGALERSPLRLSSWLNGPHRTSNHRSR